MENQLKVRYTWSAVRVEVGSLFFEEHKLNKARRDLRKLKKNFRELLENNVALKAEIDQCMGENKASHDELDDVKAKAISEKEAEIVSFKASRNAQKSTVKEMLRAFKGGRWTIVMGIEDMGAIGMMKDLKEGLNLYFTMGKSVKQDVGLKMNQMMHDLSDGKITKFKYSKLYKLTSNGRVRIVGRKECKRLKFDPKAKN
ncbi:hypothetical protein PHJA_000355700 [Phtheirospermum japonicum]|uniref:Uncharacterized protein n=1 Tax=Phtheirospermum japonicum TaxID=374723 RepID=A0A830BBH8_9LAMI|nr:hypothetical protein PHJA_000355700 [Phtheirospermum japonicum]